jgi:signal transduction histidine kinase/CheY-like chemotaxis protein
MPLIHRSKKPERGGGSSSNGATDDEETMDIENMKVPRSSLSVVKEETSDYEENSIQGGFLHQNNKWVFISLILFIGAGCSGAFLALGIIGATNESEKQFEQRAIELTFAIQSVAHDYELFGLWIHESCLQTYNRTSIPLEEDYAGHLGFCSRAEFKRLHEYISSVGVEAQAIEYVPLIANDVRSEVERQSKIWFAENYPHVNYEGITRVVPDKNPGLRTAPEVELPFYFPLHYVEPVLTNEPAIELNPYSNPARAKAIDTAIDTWKPAFSDRLKLVQETDSNAYGVGLVHPGVPSSIEVSERPQAFSQIIIRMPALLERAARIALVDKSVYIYDSSKLPEEPIFLGGADVHVTSSKNKNVLTSLPESDIGNIPRKRGSRYYETRVPVADRYWTISVVSQDFESELIYVILGGAIIFVACVILAFLFYSHLVRVAKMNTMRSEAEAEKSRIAVKQAMLERELNEFIAHEVRNPLSSAIAALSFVSAAAKDPVQDETTKKTLLDDICIIDASLQFINELLRNMLDIHRAADKQMKLDLKPADVLRDVFEPVASILFMRGAKVDIITECPENLMVNTDRMRLKQIVLNLAANSTKFVEQGYIRLRAEVVDGSVLLSIEDSGPGIPPEKCDRLFCKFQESLDLLNQGTGIGLCVCKNLSELMGADIWLDNKFDSGIPGCPGTRFGLRLNQPPIEEDLDSSEHNGEGQVGVSHPRRLAGGKNEPASEDLPLKMSVLFVDDDTVLRKMFTRALRRVAPDWEIQEASNGETALRMVEKDKFDIIFIDQYMASIEKQLLGTETVREIRAKGVQSIICGLSANDTEELFLDAGATAFMFKPFACEKKALQAEINRVLAADVEKKKKALEW